jgi:hypothetical protein
VILAASRFGFAAHGNQLVTRERPCKKHEPESCLGVRNIRDDFSDNLRHAGDKRLLNEIAALVVKDPGPVLEIGSDKKKCVKKGSRGRKGSGP